MKYRMTFIINMHVTNLSETERNYLDNLQSLTKINGQSVTLLSPYSLNINVSVTTYVGFLFFINIDTGGESLNESVQFGH